ncbi:hypothetical protein N7481_007121 [Penicillium waksmanii]|uniref:uncharacterized protein n=1 Tax=Penicillium waksmanii TaxID=69791 RepID=UPI002548D1DE|nr:uncharacterized protein N7481_007121 [Penicillium waksmanii]KAJ5979823.1 hypothetical protein N7481_007121 [Penicillium waksmanii]
MSIQSYGVTVLAVFAIAGVILVTVSVIYGIGSHENVLSESDKAEALKWGWINQLLGLLATSFGKLAIVAFLQQIHGPEHRERVVGLWILAISNLIVNAIAVGMVLTQCAPLKKLWDFSVPGTCDGLERNEHFAYFQGSWSAFCDLALALYPIVFLWTVRLQIRVKIGLCALMGVGVIACICSILKTTLGLTALGNGEDLTYNIARLIIWNETEKWAVIIVGCIPPIRPLFIALFHKVAKSTKSRSGQTNGNGRSTELHSFSQGSKAAPRVRHSSPALSSAKESEESILAMEDGAIMKTTDISLTYENGEAHHEPLPSELEHGGCVVPSERI